MKKNNDLFLSSGSLDPGDIAIKLYKYIKQIHSSDNIQNKINNLKNLVR